MTRNLKSQSSAVMAAVTKTNAKVGKTPAWEAYALMGYK
jgi:hypothetical protein